MAGRPVVVLHLFLLVGGRVGGRVVVIHSSATITIDLAFIMFLFLLC